MSSYFSEFNTDFLPYTEGLHLDMRHEIDFTEDDALLGFFPKPQEVFKTNFQQSPVKTRFQPSLVKTNFQQSPDYKEVAQVLKTSTYADVYMKGSPMYEKRRKLKNGMCKYIFPDLVVVPKSTEDVSNIVKTAYHYHIPISVRSGGHSYICQSIKPGNI